LIEGKNIVTKLIVNINALKKWICYYGYMHR